MREINEEFLKENLKISVDISTEFRDTLLYKLGKENTKSLYKLLNNLISMATKYNQFILSIVIMLVLVVGSIGGYIYYQNSLTNIGKVYISEGSLEILRGGVIKEYTKDTTLKEGDLLITKDNSVVDVKYGCTRVAMDNNTEVKFTQTPQLSYGTAYISSCEDNQIDTTIAVVNVNGAALITHVRGNEEISSSLMKLIVSAYANDIKESLTKVVTVNGDVSVKSKTDEKLLSVKTGEQVIISKDIKKEEFNKEEINSEFMQKISYEYGNDSEIIKDLTNPKLTIISPSNGNKSTDNKVTVKFKSNEDGWYYNDTWKEIVKDKEYSKTFSLQNGENKLEIIIKDKGYNKTKGYVTVVYSAPVPQEIISWSTVPTAQTDGVYMKWYGKNLKPGTLFKVYRNNSLYKSYTINSKEQSNSFLDTDTVKGKTYTYKISVYNKKTVVLTSEKSVIANTLNNNSKGKYLIKWTMNPSTCIPTITLVSLMQSYSMDTSKQLSLVNTTGTCNGKSYSGYKIVWGKTKNPTYPGDKYKFIPTTENYGSIFIEFTEPGTWYIRVGTYNGGIIEYSSNYKLVIQ